MSNPTYKEVRKTVESKERYTFFTGKNSINIVGFRINEFNDEPNQRSQKL